MTKPRVKPKAGRRNGPAEAVAKLRTISATVPEEIARQVKAETGKRGFSKFVARAIARELLRKRREEFVRDAEETSGPVDEKRLRAVLALLDA